MKSLGVAYAISKRNKAKSPAKGDAPEKKEEAPKEKDEPEDARGLFEFHMNEAMRYHDMLDKDSKDAPIDSEPDSKEEVLDEKKPSPFAKAIAKK